MTLVESKDSKEVEAIHTPKNFNPETTAYTDIISYQLNPRKQKMEFYSVDEKGSPFMNHGNLKSWLATKGKTLVFAMNGGIYKKDLSPQGLYIEDGLVKAPVDTISKGYGNFYLQPNGIFYLTKEGEAQVLATDQHQGNDGIQYATQSGPMLVVEGNIHPAFNKGSKSMHIRNGVGVLPNGNLLFAISKQKVNFYRFASFFKDHQCQNALYLDGFVSRLYLPQQNWTEEDGVFGIIIAEVQEH